MNYAELLDAVGRWANRADLGEEIPLFVQLAEARFNRVLRTSQMVGRATIATASSYFSLPVDFLEAISLKQPGSDVPLISYVTPMQMDTLRLQTQWSGEALQHYSIIDTNLHLWPTQGEAVSVEMTYYKKIPSLSDSVQTNWLIERAPDAYLYGALLQMEGYLGQDARIPVWVAGLQSVLDELNAEAERNKYPRSGGLVMRTSRSF
jgi:hypothetical protein